MRRNPKITQRTDKTVLYDDRPMCDVTSLNDVDENIIVYGPFGKAGQFFGYDASTSVLYFFADPEDRAAMYEKLKANKVKSPPLFHRARAGFMGRGTIERFWENRATAKMIAAVQYFTTGDTLVVTHMAVRPKWRRNRVNTLLIDWLVKRYKSKHVVFDEPTDQGKKFMKSYGVK